MNAINNTPATPFVSDFKKDGLKESTVKIIQSVFDSADFQTARNIQNKPILMILEQQAKDIKEHNRVSTWDQNWMGMTPADHKRAAQAKGAAWLKTAAALIKSYKGLNQMAIMNFVPTFQSIEKIVTGNTKNENILLTMKRINKMD